MKSFFQLKEYLEIGTDEIVNTYKKATPGEVDESTKNYAQSLAKIADKAKKNQMTKKDLDTLSKLAQMMAKANESVELEEAKYSWNDVNKALTKANYMRGNPAHISKVADKFKHKSGNDKSFTLQDVKKNLSAAGIDGAKQHNIMKHMNESVELEEAPLKMKMRDMKKAVADMVLDADDKTLMKIARMLGKKLYFDKKGNPIMENPEDNEPASPDESSMAIKQAKFIQYVGEEVEEYIENNQKFPEWMQNKLSGLHEKAMSVHAAMGGDYDDDMDEAYKKKTPGQKLAKSLKKSGLDLDKSEKFYRDMLNKYKQDKK